MYGFSYSTYLPEFYINSNYRYNFKNQIIEVYYFNSDTNNYEMVEVYPNFDYHQSKPITTTEEEYNTASYDSSIFTTNEFYKYDISTSLVMFTIFFLFIIYLPYKIFSRFFGRWLKV